LFEKKGETQPTSRLTVEGIYKDGKVELIERPDRVEELACVLVTFLATGTAEPSGDKVPDREALRHRAFARMREGVHLGGPPYPKREELHDRFDR
jgi:hypothetical protein